MNWEHMCPGCMHELTEEEYKSGKCPHCDYEREKENREQALAVLTILNGKYLIGKILEKDSTSITYQAYDLNLEIKIQITEYFPLVFAKRAEDGRNIIPISEEATEAYEIGKKNNLDSARQFVKMVTRSGGENLIRDFFEENNTVYTALIDNAIPSVTAMPENFSEKQGGSNKKKKIIWLVSAAVALVAVCIMLILLIGAGDGKFKVDKDWKTVYKSFMLGTMYQDDIAVFATDSSLYYGEYDEKEELSQIYWLADLNVNEALYCVDSDDKYLYVSVTNNGIFRADIENKEVEYKQIVNRDTLEFVLYDKYIYYVEGDTLYKAKKDGSDEKILAENASFAFTMYKNSIFYYSNADECIYRINENGEKPLNIAKMSGVTKLLASGANLWVVKDGILYQMDIGTGEIEQEEKIDSVGSNSEIYVSDNVVFYLSSDNKKVNAYNVSTKETKVLYNGTEILMTGMMKDNLYIVNSQGEYHSLNVKDNSKKKMKFNYLSMSQDCIYE